MKNRCVEGAAACVGAVVGAGFVSGREVISFFSGYGGHSWWLIAVSVATAILLTALCLRRAPATGNWCALFDGRAGLAAEMCVTALLCVVGGAMVSASGHMVALLWPSAWAYSLGAVGSLFLAWLVGSGGVKPLSLGGGALTLVLLAALAVLIKADGGSAAVAPAAGVEAWALIRAAVCAAAYAAMNITIAIGVICKAGRGCCRKKDRLSATFGLLLALLLFLGNYLYLKHPELLREPFPVVRLFSAFGRTGYLASVALLYLAIFTTLAAILYALRSAVEERVRSRTLSASLTLGLPLLVSLVGFAEIVDGLYAPVGLLCLLTIFLPLTAKGRPAKGKKEGLDNSSGIQ